MQTCVDAMMRVSVTERRVTRRLPVLARAADFEQIRTRSHGYADTDGGCLLSVVDRRADALAASGEISAESA